MTMSRGKQRQTEAMNDSLDLNPTIIENILKGKIHVISHPGASQYARPGGGVSACGLAALNCAKVVFGKELDGLCDEALLREIMSLETATEIMSICTQWSTEAHLEVEDIYKIPIFARYMRLISTRYSRPGLEQFRTLLSQLAVIDTSAAVIITRPPEIIACVKIAVYGKPIFLIFDSHPRPCHPNGAGFIFSNSINYTAEHLNDLLAVDLRLLADGDMQWQAQLLANFSGHIFVRVQNDPSDLTQALLESSLAILALQAEVADVKHRNSALEGKIKQSEEKIREKVKYAEMEQHRSLNLYGSPPHGRNQAWNSNNNARTTGLFGYINPWTARNVDKTPSTSAGPSSYAGATARSHYTGSSYSTQMTSPLYPSDEDNQPTNVGCPISRPVCTGSIEYPMNQDADEDSTSATSLYFEGQMSEMMALQQQCEFEEEDRRLRKEREVLAKVAPTVFSCGICLEEHLEDDVARVEGCEHAFCRVCVRSYITSKVDEHRFPILCPSCVAERKNKEPEVITNSLIQQVGIEEKCYEIYQELQMTSVGILLHCRQCKQSAFVDRQEYRESTLIVCPFPKCQHMWCKACQHTVVATGPRHSCDGSSELEHLMKQRGWKRCPGCRTPIFKDTGCNHMTCLSPGCNSHFCYLCGNLIVRSGLSSTIKAAVTAHFSRCRLFEHVPDRDVAP